jgi:hypothetical protein
MAHHHYGRVLSAAAGVAAAGVLAALAVPAAAVRAAEVARPGASPAPVTATGRPGALDPKHPYRHGVVWLRGSAAARAARAPRGKGATGRTGRAVADPANNLSYRGGNDGLGVQSHPEAVYLVFWGSQWGTQGTDSKGYLTLSGDPAGEAPRLQGFFAGLGGGVSWSGVMTQYCQNVAVGTQTCPAGAQYAGYPKPRALAGVWADESAPSPSNATYQQLQDEAVAAAVHFGNKTAASNDNAQYIVASPTGTHPDGFNTPSGGYCAWHSFVSSAYGPVMFTNLGYIPDMGGSCGENIVNRGAAGALDGVTIAAGHEYAEIITDPTIGGWADSAGYENADKCVWITSGQGAMADINLSTGSFPVQSTWANDSLSTASGCMLSDTFAGAGNQSDNAAASKDTNPGIANYDGAGFSYSASALTALGLTAGASVNVGGITFTWPKGRPGWADNWVAAGQRLSLSGSGHISFLGSATGGPASGTATVTYTDGSTQPVPVTLADWTLTGGSAPPAGEQTVASISYRNGGVPDTTPTYLFATPPVSLAAGKQVAAVTLPATVSGGTMHIFAVGFGSSAIQDVVSVTNPGNQDTAYGANASLQIMASDSASGQTLAYHASGLPAGLSIDSATGLISGTPAATGRFAVGVTVTDGGGASARAAFAWTIPVPTGTIVGVNGLCVDDRSSITTDGNPVQVWGCDQTNAQNWGMNSDGTVQALGKCMTVNNGGTTDGSLVVLWHCTGAGSQIWRPEANGELINPASGKCLEDPGSGSWGTQLDITTCTGAADQQWTVPS